MAIDPAVLRAMQAAGATIDIIIAAIEADAAQDTARREAKRANNAERQRRFKARHRDEDNTGNAEVTHDNAGNALPSVTPLSLPPNENISNPPTHTPGYNTRARKVAPAKPDGVSERVWLDFIAHRKLKRADVSETAMSGIRREAEKAGWTLEAALVECMARGWQGVKADWLAEAKPKPSNDIDPMMAAFRARKAAAAPP